MGRGWMWVMGTKEIKYMVREGDCTLDGEPQWSRYRYCIPEVYIILLNNITPNHFNKNVF